MTFSQKLLSNFLPPGKNVRSNITEILHPKAQEMICGHGHEQKFRYHYPLYSTKIQKPYPQAKAIDQNPALCPNFNDLHLKKITSALFYLFEPRGWGNSPMKQSGILVISLRGVNFGFWSRLGCSGQSRRQYFMPPRSRLGFHEETQN